jgi:anti-anti-sigma factor
MTVTAATEMPEDPRAGPDEIPPASPSRTGRSIVRLRGSLDFAAAKELRERLIDVLHRGASPLIIDLSHVRSGDAAGLAVLIGTQRRARLLGSVVLLTAPSLPVAELLRSTGLHRHFTIYPDIPAALASQRHEPARTVLLESAVG